MQQITLEIKPIKLPFFWELIGNLDFVKVKNIPQGNREIAPENNIKKDYEKLTKNTEDKMPIGVYYKRYKNRRIFF